ncbi:MAG TPA: AMP-binding protein, partial [Acidimicrobiales bacterium]
DVFFALGGGIDALTRERATRPEQMVEKGKAGFPVTLLPIAPLMHGATQWAVMGQSFTGNKIVLVSKFDPDAVWRLVGQEKVNAIMITGDAMARPLVEALDRRGAGYDTSSLLAISSTAALFSPSVKDDLFRLLPNVLITEAIGSSESGNNGLTQIQPGNTAMKGGPTVTPQPGVRYSIPGGFRDGRSGRHHHPAPPRLGVDQLGRREDLPRGGRGRGQVTPSRVGRRGDRRARRALGSTGGGSDRDAARRVRATRGSPGPLPQQDRRLQSSPPGHRG